MQLLPNIYISFPGGKHKVLTMSYDDGKTQDRRLVSLFNQYQIKGTFHLNSGRPKEDPERLPLSEYKELYEGHEVSCHTMTHPTIARCPIEQVALQIMEDRKHLEHLVQYPVRGLSYPNGSYSKEIIDMLPHLGIRYARTVKSTGNFEMPEDFLEWHPTCHHNENLLAKGKAFLELDRKQHLYMMYVWGHSYEFADDDNWELMESFCNMMAGKDDTWYATNIEIVDYLQCARNLQFTLDSSVVYNPSFESVWIEYDGSSLEIPGGTRLKLRLR